MYEPYYPNGLIGGELRPPSTLLPPKAKDWPDPKFRIHEIVISAKRLWRISGISWDDDKQQWFYNLVPVVDIAEHLVHERLIQRVDMPNLDL